MRNRDATEEIYVSDTEARQAINALMLVGALAIAAGILSIWITIRISSIEAKPAPILAKSELTAEQIKRLHVIAPRTESRN